MFSFYYFVQFFLGSTDFSLHLSIFFNDDERQNNVEQKNFNFWGLNLNLSLIFSQIYVARMPVLLHFPISVEIVQSMRNFVFFCYNNSLNSL